MVKTTHRRLWRAASMVLGAVAIVTTPARAAELPTVCIAGSCGTGGPSGWVTSGSATATSVGNTFTVNQTSDRAVLNWATFNISADGRVVFQQPSSSSIALNRIYQEGPSQIFGQLQANGEIYLVNPNGVIFGKTAIVNAAGILASTLNISDATFNTGIASPSLINNSEAALQSDGRIGIVDRNGLPITGTIDANGNITRDPAGQPIKVRMVVQEGASLSTTGPNGRILLAAQDVSNAGTLGAADGQVLMAAGQKVYLQASQDPSLRGLLVEVDAGGTAWNQLSGQISAARGNATLVGLAVNQDGRISATTTVAANGSIRLLARDGASVVDQQLTASRNGSVVFGSQSSTTVLPEFADVQTAVDEQQQFTSSIEALGHTISVHGGGLLRATGGTISLAASATPTGGNAGVSDSDSQLRIDPGAVLDVSGSAAYLPMSRNLVTLELRGNELRDAPSQRDGALRGQTVVVDARVGTPLADVSGALAAIPKSVAERTVQGGTIRLISDGDIVAAAGSTFDVSGGSISYAGGVVQTTQLIGADGKLYDIGTADRARSYIGILNPTFKQVDDRWGQVQFFAAPTAERFEPGYIEGRSAGTLQFAAPNLVLNGSFIGQARTGPYQRDAGTVTPGGRLIVGLQQGVGLAPNIDYRAPSVQFANVAPTIAVQEGRPLLAGLTLTLSKDYLGNGFTRTEIYSNGTVSVPTDVPLQLSAGSSFKFSAPEISLRSDIRSAGGSLEFNSVDAFGGPVVSRPGVTLGAGITLDVSGTWTNDSLLLGNSVPRDLIQRNAGSISLAAIGLQSSALLLGDSAQLLASAGAYVNRTGVVAAGRGGAIRLLGTYNTDFNIGSDVKLAAFGVTGANGGSFALTAPRVSVGTGASWAPAQSFATGGAYGRLQIGSALFNSYGFANLSLSAVGTRDKLGATDTLQIAPGAIIDAYQQSMQLSELAVTRPTGGGVAAFSALQRPLPFQRLPMQLTFSTGLAAATSESAAAAGNLSVGTGSVVSAEPGSTMTMSTLGSLLINGMVVTHGGNISVIVRNPPTEQDAGYIADQRLVLGAGAVLDVSGVGIDKPSDSGLLSANILAGGSVSLLANRGYITLDQGSRVDISGAAAAIDIATGIAGKPYQRSIVGSAAGTVLVRAPEAIGLYGQLSAFAGIGDSVTAAAGALALELTRNGGFSSGINNGGYPITQRVIQLTANDTAPGAAIQNGLATLSTDFIRRSGIDALSLRADDQISIAGGTGLSMVRSIGLDAASINVSGTGPVNLAANYVSIGNSQPTDSAAVSLPGNSDLNVRADFIDLVGSSVLGSIATATLSSAQDIRLLGTRRVDGSSTGGLTIAGDLTLNAVRVYGATISNFALRVAGGSRDRISILQNANAISTTTPLSAGSNISVSARDIVQGGTLLAPFGSIALAASNSVSLLDGSRTSVSGAGALIPYGSVTNGDWSYVNAVTQFITAVPARQVSLTGASVSMAAGATVDLRGGGDLFGYEWVPGTGGSKDALAPGAVPGLFAILPALAGQFAPYDPQEYAGSELRPGDSVYLSGNDSVPAGTYALLPARYALLPGALLVSQVPGTTGIAAGTVNSLPDGTPVIAGYRSFGSTQLGSSQMSGFAVRPGSYGRALAAYNDNFASSFFAARAQRLESKTFVSPADAGSLSLFAGTALDARGSVLTTATAGGTGAAIDISALRLAVVASAAGNSGSGSVQIGADQLTAWNPARLTLGGQWSATDPASLTVRSNEVSVADGVRLSFDQIVMVARDRISIGAGAMVATRSAANSALLAAPLATPVSVKLADGNDATAAFLALSDLARWLPSRTGIATTAASINVNSGATLGSRGAITLDAPGGGALDGQLGVAGAQLALSAERLVFGSVAQAGAFTIAAATQLQLAMAQSVQLKAVQSIDLLRSVALDLSGTAGSRIELNTPHLNAAMPGLSANFAAGDISLTGAVGVAATAATPGTSNLQMHAGTLQLGPGNIAVDGFAQSVWTGTSAVVGHGIGQLSLSGNLDVLAPLVTVASDADTVLSLPGGNLRLLPVSGAASANTPLELGGSLRLVAGQIDSATRIAAPSGLVTLQTGNDLHLLDGGIVDVAGRIVAAGGRQVGSHGGTVRLQTGGRLFLDTGSTIDLSAAGDSAAGQLQADAAGAATLAGRLLALPGTDAPGGAFSLDAQSLTGFSSLLATLQIGQFSRRQRIHLLSGDLVLNGGDQINADAVELIADSGSVRVSGKISTVASDAGDVRIFAGTGLTLFSGAQLHADATTAGASGGNIILGTTSGTIDLQTGSIVSAAGPAGNGRLTIRSPTVGNDIAVTALAAKMGNVGSVVLAPTLVFNLATATPSAANMASYASSASAFITTASAAIQGRLNPATAIPLVLRPDIELRRSGNLALGSLDLTAWRFAGQPGALTVRATGSLQLSGTISDGFSASGAGNAARVDLLPSASNSISMVAGANLAGADPLALSGSAASDLVLGAGAIVRTGTGDVSLAAARDVVFNSGASAYTGGVAGAASQLVRNTTTVSALVLFPDQGGSLSLSAGRDVVGSAQAQSVSTWQARGTRVSANATAARLYGVNAARFGWNLGSLGGGDIQIRAGRDVYNLSAAAADSALVDGNGQLNRFGGGSLSVDAARNIATDMFYGGRGVVSLRADGAVNSVRATPNGDSLSTVIALGSASALVRARSGVALERVFDPGLLTALGVDANRQSFFSTRSAPTTLRLQSAAGNVDILSGNPNSLSAYVEPNVANTTRLEAFSIYPSSLTVRAFSGDAVLGDQVTLSPADNSQLDVFAKRDLVATGNGGITMSDAAVAGVATIFSPQGGAAATLDAVLTAKASRHLGDLQPIAITAGRDVNGGTYSLAKNARVTAGRDVFNATINGQNLQSSDLTLISAGRDIGYSPAAQLQQISLGGPGRLDITAGRTIDLGFTRGITTTGRLLNASIPDTTGADITVMAGLGTQPDYSAILSAVVLKTPEYNDQLVAYMEQLTGSPQSLTSALAAFRQLAPETQRPYILSVYFAELIKSGREANLNPTTGFARGYAAIDALFPGSRNTLGSAAANPFSGDLNMSFSRIYSLAGGDIKLLVPGGQVNVGLANPPAFARSRPASELGIVAQRAGNVDIFTARDVLVNASRVFTLLGGDIAVWSTLGNIDAGRGAKSSVSAPPPRVLIDANGKVTLDFSGAVAGSGIRTIATAANVKPGNVDLIAPVGTVNAGDAGIGCAGNCNIAARQVIGAENIQIGGNATGVPAQAGGLALSVSGASGAASGASNSSNSAAEGNANGAAEQTPLAQTALSWLEVFVLGLGDENCKQDDLECLKRQKK